MRPECGCRWDQGTRAFCWLRHSCASALFEPGPTERGSAIQLGGKAGARSVPRVSATESPPLAAAEPASPTHAAPGAAAAAAAAACTPRSRRHELNTRVSDGMPSGAASGAQRNNRSPAYAQAHAASADGEADDADEDGAAGATAVEVVGGGAGVRSKQLHAARSGGRSGTCPRTRAAA